jgi:photosystem II stability/assembly factor-like uncharacterized protein
MRRSTFAVAFVILAAGGIFTGVRVAEDTARAEQGVRDGRIAVANTAGEWVSIGPPVLTGERNRNLLQSGRVSSIAVDPADESHWLAGFGNGGVWETHDSGADWAPVTDAVPTSAIGAIAFAPSDPNVVYVGTGESAGVSFAKVGLGILKSTDGGNSWTLLAASSFARASVKRIRVHPQNPNIVLAITTRGGVGRDAGDIVPSPPPFGVLRSTDGGNTWSRSLAGQATALEADPRSFDRLYAGIGDQRIGVLNDSPGSVENGVYRSTNGGSTWTLIEGPWGRSSNPRQSTVGRVELAIAPSNPDVLYASFQIPPNGGTSATGLLGLYRTDNAWAAAPTWIRIPTDAASNERTGDGGYCGPGKCGYTHTLSVDPGDADTLIAGGSYGIFRCADCRSAPTWTELAPNVGVHPDYHALAWVANRLIVGTDGGVYSTTDRGATWQSHNRTLPTLMFFSGALHPANTDFILGGLRDYSMVYRRGGNWVIAQPLVPGWSGGEGEVAMSSSRPDTDWVVARNWGVIQRTVDGGLTGIQADGGIDRIGAAFVAPVRKCAANDDVFLTGTNRLWRTNNFFSSAAPVWTANSPAHPYQSPQALDAPGAILSIAFAAQDRECNTYAYGNRGGEIRLTRDGGRTWKDLDSGRRLPPRPLNGLAFDPANPQTLYAVFSGFDHGTPDRPGHVFKSTNAMSEAPTWTNVSPAWDQPFNVVAVDAAQPNLVYAGSDSGLWRSHDGAQTWIQVGPGNGIPYASVYDIQIDATTQRTIVFTYGRSAYQLVVPR